MNTCIIKTLQNMGTNIKYWSIYKTAYLGPLIKVHMQEENITGLPVYNYSTGSKTTEGDLGDKKIQRLLESRQPYLYNCIKT